MKESGERGAWEDETFFLGLERDTEALFASGLTGYGGCCFSKHPPSADASAYRPYCTYPKQYRHRTDIYHLSAYAKMLSNSAYTYLLPLFAPS